MVAWSLVPSLSRFRNEVNERWPKRDKKSDGTIGDAAHQATNSDHNPDKDGSVDAWDMDRDLTGNDAESDRIIYNILIPAFQRHPAARYWIYKRKIAHRFEDNWAVRDYHGPNPHDEHVHWNSNQATEKDTSPWLTKDDDMSVTDDALKAILTGSGSGSFNQPNNLHVKLNGILAAILKVDEEVLAKIGSAATPTEQAELLRTVLGDRAKEVGRLLANG